MQWVKKEKKSKSPKEGDRRIVLRFLFLPKEINGVVRWLCFAKIEQRFWHSETKYHSSGGVFGGPCTTGGMRWWSDESWVYTEDEKKDHNKE